MSYRDAMDALLQAQKPARGASLYSLYVNRPMGRFLAAVSANVGLRPNEVTALSGFCSLLAIVLVAVLRPSVVVGLAIGLLLVVGFGLDASDGQLARLTRQSSPTGEWFDHLVDCAKIVLLHSAVLISFYRFPTTDSAWPFAVPLGMLLVSVIMFFGGNLAHQLIRGSRAVAPPVEVASPWKALALLPADSGIICCAFLLFGLPHLFVVVYTLLFVANALICAALLVKWTRQIADISA
jgi:phosphatidylglycerophosphate synthase